MAGTSSFNIDDFSRLFLSRDPTSTKSWTQFGQSSQQPEPFSQYTRRAEPNQVPSYETNTGVISDSEDDLDAEERLIHEEIEALRRKRQNREARLEAKRQQSKQDTERKQTELAAKRQEDILSVLTELLSFGELNEGNQLLFEKLKKAQAEKAGKAPETRKSISSTHDLSCPEKARYLSSYMSSPQSEHVGSSQRFGIEVPQPRSYLAENLVKSLPSQSSDTLISASKYERFQENFTYHPHVPSSRAPSPKTLEIQNLRRMIAELEAAKDSGSPAPPTSIPSTSIVDDTASAAGPSGLTRQAVIPWRIQPVDVPPKSPAEGDYALVAGRQRLFPALKKIPPPVMTRPVSGTIAQTMEVPTRPATISSRPSKPE